MGKKAKEWDGLTYLEKETYTATTDATTARKAAYSAARTDATTARQANRTASAAYQEAVRKAATRKAITSKVVASYLQSTAATRIATARQATATAYREAASSYHQASEACTQAATATSIREAAATFRDAARAMQRVAQLCILMAEIEEETQEQERNKSLFSGDGKPSPLQQAVMDGDEEVAYRLSGQGMRSLVEDALAKRDAKIKAEEQVEISTVAKAKCDEVEEKWKKTQVAISVMVAKFEEGKTMCSIPALKKLEVADKANLKELDEANAKYRETVTLPEAKRTQAEAIKAYQVALAKLA